MYTTSRYASADTRRLARRMAADDGRRYAARGKKTVAGLVSLARRRGDGEVCIIGEEGGRPSAVSCLEVLENGGWKWKARRPL